MHFIVTNFLLVWFIFSTDEESSQIFVPFLNDVKIGVTYDSPGQTSVDIEEAQSASLSSSPPTATFMDKVKDNHTPPGSPNVNTGGMVTSPIPARYVAHMVLPENPVGRQFKGSTYKPFRYI